MLRMRSFSSVIRLKELWDGEERARRVLGEILDKKGYQLAN